jgi:hypothetical protein
MSAHRAHRIEIELQVDDAECGRRLSARVSVLGRQRLAAVLDRVFSEHSSALSDGGRIDRLERLELDLGRLTEDAFDDTFLARLEATLRDALAAQLRLAHTAMPLAQSARELLECFALTGNLPWWAERHAPDLLAGQLRHLLAAGPAPAMALLRALADDGTALARIARACDDANLALWVADAPATAALLALEAALQEALAQPRAADAQALLRPRVLARQARGQRVEGEPALQALLAALPRAARLALRAWSERPPASPGSAAAALPREVWGVIQGLRSVPAPPSGARPRAADDARADVAGTDVAGADVEGTRADPALAAATAEPARRVAAVRRRALAGLEELNVDDAGLVMLWPFLEAFFTRLGLVGDGRCFTDAAAAQRAVSLLAWLAFEDPEPPEYRLPLAKLLCGLPVEAHFDPPGPPDPGQIEECAHLLDAVVTHAPVLREMPGLALRGTFLQRPGVLGTRAGRWLLHVERQPQDELLDRFSWSWAWVKLPWMAQALQVEW